MKILSIIGGIIISIFILLFYPNPGKAATYLSDAIEIPLRVEPLPKGKLVENLSSAQSVEVLGLDGEWSHIRIQKPDGSTKTGWVPSRYVVTRLPWEVQAKNMERENAALKEKLAGYQELEKANQASAEALKRLQDEYDTLRVGSANYVKLKEEYETTKSALLEAQNSLQQVREENDKLRVTQQLQWFLAGGSVMLIGWLFGLVMGRHQKRRQTYRLS